MGQIEGDTLMIDITDILSVKTWATTAAAIMLAAGTVNSVEADDDAEPKDVVVELQGGFDKPLNETRDDEVEEQDGASNITSVMTHSQNGRSYTVRMSNGKTTVERDGRELGKDEYRSRDGMIEFLDAEGNIEYTMELPVVNHMPGALRNMRVWRNEDGLRGLNELFRADRDWAPLAEMQDPPPVMLGVTLAQDDDGVRIDSVREGLPADRAGLKAGDVIVRVADKDIEKREDLTEYLRTRKPGDEVEVVVERDDERKTLNVTLAKWDGGRMGVLVVPDAPNAPQAPGLAPEAWVFGMGEGGRGEAREALREARKALEEAVERLNAARGDAEAQLKDARSAMRSALDDLRKAEEAVKDARVRLWNPEDGRLNLTLPRMDLDEGHFREQMEKFMQERLHHDGAAGQRDSVDSLRKEMEALREEVRRMRDEARQKRDER
jgi:Asp-tRNA(Asn)/Glu-tRNA(Gln) amidotransferase C subunit